MSLHATLFAAAGIGQLLRTQGEAITYTPPEGDPVSLTALVGDKRVVRKDRQPTGSIYDHERLIQVGRDPDDAEFGGLATVHKKATITYGSELLAIVGIESESVSHYELRCGYVAAANLAAPDTRMISR